MSAKERLLCAGLDEKLAEDTVKNAALTGRLLAALDGLGLALPANDGSATFAAVDRVVGNGVYQVVSRLPETCARYQPALLKHVVSGGIKTNLQITSAVTHVKGLSQRGADLDEAAFIEAAGVGVDISDAEVPAAVAAFIASHRDELLKLRYAVVGKLLAAIKLTRLRWADGKVLKDEFDRQILDTLGPRTAEDNTKKADSSSATSTAAAAPKTVAPPALPAESGGAAGAAAASDASIGAAAGFQGRELASAQNSAELIAEHVRATGGRVRTRFPPEPNGYLHIGHAKSMYLNFRHAFKIAGVDGGDTIFRYDDTNPSAESHEYVASQAETVAWMGWKPCKVTFCSDYFDQLYEFALRLIREGKAYVCHQTKAEVEACRAIAGPARVGRGDPNSPWRNRTVEENLREFEKMRLGMYAEGAATLRLKIDMRHANPTMWDPVAYRIMFVEHHRTGNKWCIYPSYDYSHCIVDSLEHIDYSLCTLEFEVRREVYYWVVEQLNLWRACVWEFSRLNLTYTMLSKRKILKMVNTGIVRGWDDPRMSTLMGLRRRGFSPAAINMLCADVGVTRAENMIDAERLEHFARLDMDQTAVRGMAVTAPLRVVLTNVADDYVHTVEVPDFPADASRGSHKIHLTRVVYIDQSDFRMVDDSQYYGLAPGKEVSLKYVGTIRCDRVETGADGTPVTIEASYNPTPNDKLKGKLHWVSGSAPGSSPTPVELRLYTHLFNDPTPDGPEWESKLNHQSEIVLHGFVDAGTATRAASSDRFTPFQFERVGFFVTDQDSTPERLVFNRTVTLRESKEKKAVAKK